jgi:hypothetical protein
MWIPLLVVALALGVVAPATSAAGERVRVVPDVDYVPGADYPDNKDKLLSTLILDFISRRLPGKPPK